MRKSNYGKLTDSPGSSPHSDHYDVNTTYVPPLHDTYTPPGPDLITPAYEGATYEDPFAPGAGSPFASGAGGLHDTVVPAIVPAAQAVRSSSPTRGGDVMLEFHDSNLPTHNITGKVGSSPQVPRVESYGDQRNLLRNGQPPSAPVGDGGAEPDTTAYSMFNIKRYRRYFNVDTSDVLHRMRDSMIGIFKGDFLEKTKDNADLYGPFWVATTLIFVIAVSGNFANMADYKKQHKSNPDGTVNAWFYDIDKVTYSAILLYGYVGLWGLAVFGVLKWFKSPISLAQVWCTYGYALTIFIPLSFICIYPNVALRYSLVAVATLTSALFILLNFKGPVYESAGAKALPLFLTMLLMHIGIGLAMVFYFFRYKPDTTTSTG